MRSGLLIAAAALFLMFGVVGSGSGCWNQGIIIGEAPSTTPPAPDPTEPVAEPEPLPPEAVCNDAIDNDEDGATDCDDSDCAADPVCLPEDVCDDSLDNDSDGATDCDDTDCADNDLCNPESTCFDGVDNDADGLTDCDDTDCLGQVCEFVEGACPSVCSQGRIIKGPPTDSLPPPVDGSGPILFCAAGPTFESSCIDGEDNDCDGAVDCDDSDCGKSFACDGFCNPDGVDCTDPDCDGNFCSTSGSACGGFCSFASLTCEPSGPLTETNCSDGINEDCDQLTDCGDSDCFSAPSCD